ncbi:hypothetical protein OC842_004813 [Tilletia horrida]|uniref:Uncharacterized protein n=1 Tax=Tilletia horrida TaxID=155126 RepID=A0AAN6GB00_9BASI|nr:hypothetical protein OC842_004813 [Tilletia horrida]
MALSAHLNAQAAKFCWPAPEDLSALDLHALLFSTPSSPGSDAVALFAIRIVPPSPQAVEPRGAGPLGPAGELNIVTELLLRLQEAGIESPDITAAEETIKELRRAQEKAMADLATERKKVQRLHVALDIEKEDVEELHSKYDNLMTVKLMLEDQINDIEISQLNKAYASTQKDSMGEQDTIAQLKFELAQADRNTSTEERRLLEQLNKAQDTHKTLEEQRSLLRRECGTISGEVESLRQQAEGLGQWSGMSYWPIYPFGLGVHGAVWVAEDLKSSQRVALKRARLKATDPWQQR